MYGWLGSYNQTFMDGGELTTAEHPLAIEYISFKHLQNNLEQVMTADDNLTFTANLVLPTEAESPPMCTELPTVMSSHDESTESSCGNDEKIHLALWILFGALFSITLLLLILLICTCQQLRKAKVKDPK